MRLLSLLPRTLLAGHLALAASMACAVPAGMAEPLPSPRPPPDVLADVLADTVLDAANRYRQQAGLGPWTADADLASIAAGHSRAQAAQGRLSHGGFEQRFAQTRAIRCVENLSAGYHHGQAVVDAWRTSPQHRQNLLDPDIDRAGVASADGVVSMLACCFSGR